LAITVTATQGGSTGSGMLLRVMALTGCALLQSGNTASVSAADGNPSDAAITTTQTGSYVYGAINYGSTSLGSFGAAPGTTLLDSITDSANGMLYGTCRTTSATGTPGSITVGASTPTGTPFTRDVALLEILPDGGGLIAEDPSSPAAVSTATATAVTTASFDPPPGALLVALVSSDGGSSVTTMDVQGGGLAWSEIVAANATSQDYAGVWIAQVPPANADDPVITAQQSGSTFKGITLRIIVLTGAQAAALQAGGTGTQSGAAAHQVSVTTTQTGSRVYGALFNDANTSYTAATGTTLIDNIADVTNSVRYGTCETTSVTGTPGAITVGASSPTAVGGAAALEILTTGTLAEDGSAPAVATSSAATFVSSANFFPPIGSLLVALVSSNGNTGTVTMTVSGGSLSWTEKVKSNGTADGYTGVWIADVPPVGAVAGITAVPPGMVSPAALSFRGSAQDWQWELGDWTISPAAVAVPAPEQLPPAAVSQRPVTSRSRAKIGPGGTPADGNAAGFPPPAGQGPQGLVKRRNTVRGTWNRTAAPFPSPGASQQPRGASPLPRRYPSRAVVRGTITSTANTLAAVAVPPPLQGLHIPRRASARALWHSGQGVLQPIPAIGGLARRRTAARAIWHGNQGGVGPGKPVTGGLTRRRTTARAIWAKVAGTVSPQPVAVAAPPQGPHIPRRTTARATVRGTVVTTINTVPVPPGTAQPRATVPVPRSATTRVIWHGSQGVLQPKATTGGLVRRRSTARAVIRGGAGTRPAPAGISGGLVKRRPPSRGQWLGTVTRTINSLPPPNGTPPLHLVVARRGTARAVTRWVPVTTANPTKAATPGASGSITIADPGGGLGTGQLSAVITQNEPDARAGSGQLGGSINTQ
jgi:hypothetical protein